MSTLQDKVTAELNDLAELGICASEATAVREAMRAYEHADLNRASAVKNAAGAGTGVTVSLAVGLICGLTSEIPLVLLGCAVAGVGGTVGSSFWLSGSMDSIDAAQEDLDAAYAALDKALDKLCVCIKRHLPG